MPLSWNELLAATIGAGPIPERLLVAVYADPAESVRLLSRLARERRWEHRFWAAVLAGEAATPPATDVLLALIHDPADEVRTEARSQLASADPRLAKERLLEGAIAALSRAELGDDERSFNLNLIGELNAIEALEDVRRYSTNSEALPSRSFAVGLVAFLEEGVEGVLGRIDNHTTHEDMYGLCAVAWSLFPERALPVFENGASQAPDDGCRDLCRSFAASATVVIRERRRPRIG
jgi:hypothetical protein